MTKLKKFKKEETNKKNVIKMVSVFMVMGIMLVGISYAVYQSKVGEFKEDDIKFAIKLDGEQIDKPPAKDNYKVTVDCDYADGEWDSEKWGALVTNINANKVKCEINFQSPGATLSEITATSTKTEISLSYKAEGKGTSTTCKYGTEEGVYPNEVEATNTSCNITNLKERTTYYYEVCAVNFSGQSCKSGSAKTVLVAELVELGDYISMTPTSTSYTLPNELSGCTGETSTCVQNTINPSELNLWRVIRKNDDGTVDMVSEYVSSQPVYFYGKTGYINYIKALNEVAAQYTNEKYILKTRHIGYNNQTEVITNTSKLSQTKAPWSTHTSVYNQWTGCTSSYLCGYDEELGAGDIEYETDYELVNVAYGNMIGYTPSGTATQYYLASRRYNVNSYDGGNFNGRSVKIDGSLVDEELYYYRRGFGAGILQSVVRPILTLKASTKVINGVGTLQSPYQLS